MQGSLWLVEYYTSFHLMYAGNWQDLLHFLSTRYFHQFFTSARSRVYLSIYDVHFSCQGFHTVHEKLHTKKEWDRSL